MKLAMMLTHAIDSLIRDSRRYLDMRAKARAFTLQTANWQAIGECMAEHIGRALKEGAR